MPAIDDLTAVRRLPDVHGPRDDVITAGGTGWMSSSGAKPAACGTGGGRR